jgi:membrane-associated protease RseP (regulator of RpoE activity)
MGSEEYKRFEFHYVLVLLRTRRFQSLMDRLGASRISRPVGWLLLYVMPVAAAFGFYLFLNELVILLSPRGAAVATYVRTLSPLANLGLPGINPYIPIVDGWIALVVAMIIHEGAHGIIARSLDLPVKSSGLILLLGFIPIGAFVDVDESALKVAKASYSGRVLAAVAGINLVFGVICLIILVAIVGAFSPAASGAGIVNVGTGTPAFNAGVKPGDIITQVNGVSITDLNSVLGPNTTLKAGEYVNLTVYRDGRIMQFTKVQLACCDIIENLQTKQNVSYPYIGVAQVTASELTTTVSQYVSPLNNPWQYVCIPTLPVCQGRVPFSDSMGGFYNSPLGSAGAPLANLMYWFFFLNFNLAVFNALPIYPLDGGQAFAVGIKALGKGKMTETTLMRITGITTVGVIALLLAVIAGPYLFNLF